MSCRWSARAQRPGTFIPLSPRLITPGSVGPPRGRQPVVGQAAPSAARRALALPGSEFAASPHSNLTLRRAPALSHPHISRRRRPASSRRISAPPAADGRVAPPIPADHQSERARTCSFFFSAPVVTSNRRIDYPCHRNHGLDKHGSKRNWNSVSVDRSELQQQRSKPVAGYSRGLHPTSQSAPGPRWRN